MRRALPPKPSPGIVFLLRPVCDGRVIAGTCEHERCAEVLALDATLCPVCGSAIASTVTPTILGCGSTDNGGARRLLGRVEGTEAWERNNGTGSRFRLSR